MIMREIKKIITTALVAILVFAGIILIKNMCSYMLYNDAMGVRSVIAQNHIDTLFVGSSAYRKGVDMYMIEEELPGNSFMLTYNGNQPFNVAIELEEIMKAGTEIETVVVDFNPSMVDRGADLSDKRLLWDISMEGKKELWSELKHREGASLFTWYDFWVSSNIDYMFTYPIAKPMISARYYRGGSASTEESEGLTKTELDGLEIIENPGIDELQMRSIDRIIDICAENDINLIFLESPRYTTMAENENYKAKSKELGSHIDSKGITVITGENLGFDNSNPEYYADLTHMSGKGGKTLTKSIIEVLTDGKEKQNN